MKDLRKPPRRYSAAALLLFRTARWLTSRIWPGRAAYRRWLARGGLEGVRVDVAVPGLPPGLEGLAIVQLSDLHAGPFLDETTLQPVVDLARAYRPDILVLTGDFVTRTADDVALLGASIGCIEAPLGKYAVFGNHDYRERREAEIAAALRRRGVTVLRNAAVTIEREGGRLGIAGLEDIEESKGADLHTALEAWSTEPDVRVLLCHHPDVVDELPAGRFHLVLSGHSHGGQIVLPLFGALARGWMPRRLRGTHALDGGGILHVNRGVGVLIVPFRIGARAEVTCLTLRAAGAPASVAPAPER